MIAEAFITDGERWKQSPTSQELKSFLNDSSGGFRASAFSKPYLLTGIHRCHDDLYRY